MALVGLVSGALVVSGATAVVAATRPITANVCLTRLAAPLIAAQGLRGVSIGVDDRLSAEVGMASPNVVRVAQGPATWCGGRFNPDLQAVISHELGHVAQYRLAPDPVRHALLRHRLEAAFGSDADALEGAANCSAEIQLGKNISRFVAGPEVCTPAMLAASHAISDGQWPA